MPVITDPILSEFFVSCDELFSGRSGTPFEASEARFGRREYVRRFRVIVKAKEMAGVSVAVCPGLPLPGSFYLTPTEYDLLALAVKFDVKPEYDDDWRNWIVEVRYSTEMPKGGFPTLPGSAHAAAGAQNNPEQEPADIEWDFEVVQQAPRTDLDSYPILNTARLPFSPPPTFPVAYPILNITRNERNFSRTKASLYAFALNSDRFLGMPPKTVQCLPPKAKQAHRGPLRYWKVSYRLKFSYLVDNENDPDYEEEVDGPGIPPEAVGAPIGYRLLQPRVLSQGMWQRPNDPDNPVNVHPDANAKPVPVYDVMGNRVSDLLDFSGRQSPVGVGGGVVSPTGTVLISKPVGRAGVKAPTFIQYRMFRTMPFTELLVNGLS